MLETAQPQAESTANQPEYMEAVPEQSGESGSPEDGSFLENDTANEQPFMTVRYNKESKPLSKEEAIVYAQKGMNYDKLQERLKQTAAKLSLYETHSDRPNGETEEEKQALIDAQLDSFMKENPGVDPRRLPESVLSKWKRGIPLNEAFLALKAHELSFKIRQMESAAAQDDANRKNEAASMGSAISNGSTRGRALSDDSIRNMTAAELEKNHDRIWAYLTGR